MLFITGQKINMLEDILHEGLDELLGPDRVYCFPYKDYSRFQYNLYPPSSQDSFHRKPPSLLEILNMGPSLAAVIVGTIRDESLAVWRIIREYLPSCPIALVHGEETYDWPADVFCTHRFKMNLLPGDSDPHLHPLPMAVPPRVMMAQEVERDIPVSFAARNTHGLRRQCAEALRSKGFLAWLSVDLPREQFCALLNRSKISISVRGADYDVFRYWEIPYHGALLLSQRVPILIPDNFVEGESAMFFDGPEEMLDKIHALLADEDELARIARNGTMLAREKHTAVARARYALGKMGVLEELGLSPR